MMHHFVRPILFGLLCGSLSLALTAVPVSAAGTVRYVDDDGKGSSGGCGGSLPIASTIQQAVDASSAGDFITVCPGTYVGQVTVSIPNLTIRGRDAWTATVKAAPDHPSTAALILALNAPGTRIKWLRLVAPTQGTCQRVGAMIEINASTGSVVRANHIDIEGTQGLGSCGYEAGVRVTNASDGTRVLWNRVTDFINRGIDLLSSASLLVRGNTVSYFHAAYNTVSLAGSGIAMNTNVAGVRILGNVVRGLPSGGHSTPGLGYGISAGMTPARIKDNRIHDVDTAVWLVLVSGASVISNVAQTGVTTGLLLQSANNNLVTFNTMHAASNGIFVTPSSGNNQIHDNDFDGASDPDCTDQSVGAGTANTNNTWANDVGTSSPAGICSLGP
jgi:nitrous oxidase accessory protein NosD